METHKRTQKRLGRRLQEIRPQIEGRHFDVSKIPARDLLTLFEICWYVYSDSSKPLGNRLRALTLCQSLADIIDASSSQRKLKPIITREMDKYSGYFEYLVTVIEPDEDE